MLELVKALKPEDWHMFKVMKEQGMSISEIARRTRVSRKTVRKYIAMEKPAKYSREGRRSVIAPYADYVRVEIDKFSVSAVRIYDEIREKGYLGSYTTVKRLCREFRRDRMVRAVYLYETEPRKQSKKDFGEFGYIEMDGKRRELHAFSIVLGYSWTRYAEFTIDISAENVIRMHLNVFSFYGGFIDTILYDKGIRIQVQSEIHGLAEYYGIVIRLCYPYRPEKKGKFESTIKYLRNNFFYGRTFSDLNDLNKQCREWLLKVNSQIHATTHEILYQRLKDEKLNPLSNAPPYMNHHENTRKISRDCYVSYKSKKYSELWNIC